MTIHVSGDIALAAVVVIFSLTSKLRAMAL
jgi:hypothetical protein